MSRTTFDRLPTPEAIRSRSRRCSLGLTVLGCKGPLFGLESTRPLTSDHVVLEGPVSGRSCLKVLIFLPLSIDASYESAKRDALKREKRAVGLVDVSVDQEWLYLPPIYYQKCTIVTGRPIVEERSPAAEDAPGRSREVPAYRGGKVSETKDRHTGTRKVWLRDMYVTLSGQTGFLASNAG